MAKTFATRLADAVRASLPPDAPFKITGHAPGWHGYFFVLHLPTAVEEAVYYVPEGGDARRRVEPEHVEDARRQLYFTLQRGTATHSGNNALWRAKYAQAAVDWRTATALDWEAL